MRRPWKTCDNAQAHNKGEEMKNNWFKSLFTDSQWDWDISKLIGFAAIIGGMVGFFLGKDGFQWVIGFGAGLLGFGKVTEAV